MDYSWHIISLNGTKGCLIKLIIEKSVKLLNLNDYFDRVIVLSSSYSDGLHSGGLLSGYALIHCKMVPKLYYLINSIPKVYGLLQTVYGNDCSILENSIKKITEKEVFQLIGTTMKKEESTIDVGVKVLITDGPFSGFRGDILNVINKRASVQLEIMGRLVKTFIDIKYLEKY